MFVISPLIERLPADVSQETYLSESPKETSPLDDTIAPDPETGFAELSVTRLPTDTVAAIMEFVDILPPSMSVIAEPSFEKSPLENVTSPEKEVTGSGEVPVAVVVVAVPVVSENKRSEK
tara:strand:+ start:1548 stop:1907 length:360 start_codon:yes stop_codon:yes gene_type:complete